jgi:hypothetical protein
MARTRHSAVIYDTGILADPSLLVKPVPTLSTGGAVGANDNFNGCEGCCLINLAAGKLAGRIASRTFRADLLILFRRGDL